MTRFILSIGLMLFSAIAFAQTTYEKVMTDKISKVAQTTSNEDLTALANDFVRIGEKEKTQWLPYYYASFCTIQKGRNKMQTGETADLDPIAEQAQSYLDKAKELNPDNAENFILSKMIHGVKMMVNPQARYMTEGAAGTADLAKAEKLDPQNPRITLLKAEDVYFTPEAFGGSKTRGMELFKKALEQFKSYQPKTNLDPNWGQGEAEYFINAQP